MTANDFKDPTLVCYAIENHPCDSRVTLTDNGIVQTLNARMGTGGITYLSYSWDRIRGHVTQLIHIRAIHVSALPERYRQRSR